MVIMNNFSRDHRSRLLRCVDDVIARCNLIELDLTLVSNNLRISFGSNVDRRSNTLVDLLSSHSSSGENSVPGFTLRSLADPERFRVLSENCLNFQNEWNSDSLALSAEMDLIAHRQLGSSNPILWNIFCKRERVVYSISARENDTTNYETFRLARILLHIEYLEAGFFPLHASTVANGNLGVCLIGDKFAGKTTLSLRCLDKLGWSYVSNDKSYLGLVNGRLTVAALPIRAGIRPGTVEMFPALRRYSASTTRRASVNTLQEERVYMRPMEIASTFGVDLLASADAHAFVHLARAPNCPKSQALLLDEASGRKLLCAQHSPEDAFEEHPYWKHVINYDLSSDKEAGASARLKRALRKIPSFILSYRNDDDDALQILEGIMSRKLK
jgi:hypothetical protein